MESIGAGRRVAILIVATMAVMLYAGTATIANVVLPQIQGSLAATQDQVAWVVTFNLVATAIMTPMTGWLTTRFGQRRVMLMGIFIFTASTFLCGIATNIVELVLYRVIQGAAGAPVVPLSQAIVLRTFPQHQHGVVTSIYGMGVVMGPIIAPTLGGYLAEAYDWRWVFFMIVPLGAVSLLGCWAFIPKSEEQGSVRLDWTGFLALALAIGCFQLLLDRGERNDWFEATEIVLVACMAGTALYLFFVQTFTSDRPFVNPRLFLDRNFAIGICITLMFGMVMYTPMVLLPTFLQNLRGYPDSIIGLLLATRGGGTLLGFIFMLFANRFDPRIWLVTGFSLLAYSGWLMAQFDINVSTWDVAWSGTLQGLGVGFLWVPLTLVTFATLERRYLPDGMAIFHLLRNMGSSIHISLAVTLVVRSAKMNYAGLTENISPFNEMLSFPWVAGLWNTGSVAGLAALGSEIQRQASMIGYINAFYMYAGTAAIVLPLILLVRWKRAPVS